VSDERTFFEIRMKVGDRWALQPFTVNTLLVREPEPVMLMLRKAYDALMQLVEAGPVSE
jgi:hypothetical protein